MATTYANIAGVFSGGLCYWYCKIKPNSNDDAFEDPIIFGTLRTYSFEDTTVWEDRLLDIGTVDQSIDVFTDSICNIADVSVSLSNVLADINPSLYVGREIEVFMGSGATMTAATSNVIFTGHIYSCESNRKDFTFICRGKGQKRNRAIGHKVDNEQNEKYRGKLKPFAYGNFTDADAFLPLVVYGEDNEAPQMVFDNLPWKSFVSLNLYDKESQRSYAVNDTTQFTLGTNANLLDFTQDIDTTLITPMSLVSGSIVVSDSDLLPFDSSTSSTTTVPTLIKIDDEVMLLMEPFKAFYFAHFNPTPPPDGYSSWVDRGYAGTEKAEHAAGAKVYKLVQSAATFRIQLNNVFYPKGFSGMLRQNGGWRFIQNIWELEGSVKNLLEDSNSVLYRSSLDDNISLRCACNSYDMIFETVGFEGEIESQYLIFKGSVGVEFDGWPSIRHKNYEAVGGVMLDGGFEKEEILRAAHISIDGMGSETASFNNLDGDDDEKDLDLSMATFYTFKVSGVTVAPGRYALYNPAGDGQFTVVRTNIAKSEIYMTGFATGLAASGSLTKISGLGDDSLTYSAYERPSIAISNISELNSKRYSVVWVFENQKGAFGGGVRGRGYAEIYRVGFLINFNVNPLKYDFYVKAQARKYVSGAIYVTQSANDLIEQPAHILEHFCREENGMVAVDFDETTLVNYSLERAQWKIAMPIYENKLHVEGLE